MTTVIDEAVQAGRPIMPKRPSRGSNFWFRSQGGLLSLLGIVIVLAAWQICAATKLWSGILPLMMNTIAGVRSLDRDYSRVAKVFCTPRSIYFLRVAMPPTVPYILSGVRLAIGRALVGAIVAEFFMGSGGLGFFVQQQAAQFNTSESMAGIVILAIVAIVLHNIVGGLYRRYALWAEPQ